MNRDSVLSFLTAIARVRFVPNSTTSLRALLAIDEEDRTVSVVLDGRTVTYERADLDELVHAYACSIQQVVGEEQHGDAPHRRDGSQDDEYPCVVLPVTPSSTSLLQRNLIYTGITSPWLNQRRLAPQRCLPRTHRLPPAAPIRKSSELLRRTRLLRAHRTHVRTVWHGKWGAYGRATLPVSEATTTALEELGRQVAEAVARGEFERARELTEEAIRLRRSAAPSSHDDDVSSHPKAC